MYSELISYVKGNQNLQNLKYSGYAIKFLEEMSLGFDYIYKKVSDELHEKKDTELSDRLQYAQKILNKYSEEELVNQYYKINQKYIQYAEINSEAQLLSFFDDVKEIPFFSLADRSVGNRHMYTFFNKHLRNLVEEQTMNIDVLESNFKIKLKKLQNIAIKFSEAHSNLSNLIDEINNLDISIINELLDDEYPSDEIKVRKYHQEVLTNLSNGIPWTLESVDEESERLRQNKAHIWTSFALVTTLYYKLFKVSEIEIEFSQSLDEIFNLTSLADEYKYRKEFNLRGSRNLGSTVYVYGFLKEKYKRNITTQISVDIDNELKVFFWDAQTNEVQNVTTLDTNSSTLVKDIIAAFEYADKVYFTNQEKDILPVAIECISKEDFTEMEFKQLIIDGAPGTGKSYGVNTEVKENDINHERVTFYSDYEYHNFIGSILPKLNGETVTYEFVKGPFTKILNNALSQPEDKHYLIVEELTRGNAAAIFGDIFQLLDRTEEGWSEYPITHDNILDSLNPEVRTFLENEYEGKVVLPPNLSIICTINSSDQNVYPLDTAFKRRFDYKIESTNVHSDFVDYDIKFGTDITVSWQDFYQKLNKYILVDLGLKEDKQVGPYFIKNHKGDNEKLESIQTKLAMYMWNDLHKVHTISNKTIFKDVHTLYEVDNLFRTGSREEILNILSTEFKQHFKLNDSKERDE